MTTGKEIVNWSGGNSPFGYKFDKKQKRLVADAKEKDTLLEIYAMTIKGYTKSDIIGRLNETKRTTRRGGMWRFKLLEFILSKKRIEFYSGFDESGNRGNWDALISPKMKKELLKRLEYYESKKKPKPKMNNFLLTRIGVCRCGYCGGSVKSSYSTRNPVRRYYVCVNRVMYKNCPDSKMVDMDLLDNVVVDRLLTLSFEAKKLEKLTKTLNEKLRAEHAKKIKEIDKLLLAALRENKSKLPDSLNKGMTEKINNLSLERIKLVESTPNIDVDFDLLKNLKTISREKTDRLQDVVKTYISEIKMFRNHAVVTYKFAINSKLENQETLYYEKIKAAKRNKASRK